MTWYNTNWNKRFKITSDNTKVAAGIKGLAYDLSNAPAGFWDEVKKNPMPTEGLVSYYKFDEGSGTVAGDSAGSNDGTLLGHTVFISDGKINGGVNIPSSNINSRIAITGASFANNNFLRDAWTISFWGVIDISDTNNKGIMRIGSSSNGNERYEYSVNSGGLAFSRRTSNTSNQITITSQLSGSTPNNDYTMITLIHDGSDNYQFYINGESVTTNKNVIGSPGNPSINRAELFNRGLNSNGPFRNRADEFAVYNRALSSGEVSALYNSGAGLQYNQNLAGSDIRITQSDGTTLRARDVISIKPVLAEDLQNGIVAYYSADNGTYSGTILQDITSKDNNGMASNNRIFGGIGIIDEGLDFTQGNDKLIITDDLIDNELYGSSQITISMWINRNSINTEQSLFYVRTASNDNAGLDILLTNDNKLRLGGRGSGTGSFVSATGSTVLSSTSNWYHIVAIFDFQNNKVISYINNVKDLDNSVSFNTATLSFNSLFTEIGNLAGTRYYNGLIDEVGIWNRALTSSEVSALNKKNLGNQHPFTSTGTGLIRFDTSNISTSADEDYYLYFGNESATEPSPSDTFGQYNAYDSGLVGYWAFQEQSGVSVLDRTLNQNSGTVNNSRVLTSGISGVFGLASDFTQGNDFIIFGNGEPWDTRFSGNFTTRIWFRFPSAPNGNHHIIGKWWDGSTRVWTLGTGTAGAGNSTNIGLRYRGGSESTLQLDSGIGIQGNTDYCLTLTKSSSGFKIFVDSNLEASTATTQNSTNTAQFSIGGSDFSDGGTPNTHFSNIIISQIMVTNYEVTTNEELTFYNNESDNASFWTTGVIEESVSLLVTTNPATNITYTTATFNGEIGGLE